MQQAAGMLALASLFVCGCSKRQEPPIIPKPTKIQLEKGHFTLCPATGLQTDKSGKPVADWFQHQLEILTGIRLGQTPASGSAVPSIIFSLNPQPDAVPESYRLTITRSKISLEAGDTAGLFYGTQTLLQLFPVDELVGRGTEFLSAAQPSTNRERHLPCLNISDHPRFAWRGMMLDVSRHFFSKDEVERYLDELAFHKINVFHWHLTDDQGWRIQIRQYPRLTEIGAWRKSVGFGLDPKSTTAYDGEGRYGGFYTQEQVREVVQYAAQRHITVVPEIEMPGHACAALAAYPELSCTGGPFKTDMPAGVFNGIFCVGNEETFTFLQNVLNEVFALFPGKYVHLGGDEVPTNTWHNCPKCQAVVHQEKLKNDLELEGYLLRRMAQFATERGKLPIGWSEVVNAGLPENAVVMDWIGGTAEAVKTGHEVIRTPIEYCYFDHYQSEDREHEPRASGALLTLQQVYEFEPVPPNIKSKFILGPQANLWTEYIPNFRQVEYMTFPRLCALAEIGWSTKESQNWEDFGHRMQTQYHRLDALGVKYRPQQVTNQ